MIPNIEIVKEEILSDNWYVLKKMTFKYQKRDGSWETQAREAYDRGNGAVILLYNRAKQTVILTRQFRMPTYMNGNATGMLIEACAGLLDQDSPEDCIRRETEEETGYRVSNVQKIGEAYMSPGSVTEILHFFVAEYTPHMQIGEGGGVEVEQEEIEVLELPFGHALNMVATGEIRDAKTIMLLQHVQLHGLLLPESGPQHILIAGPYRSNTGDDPERIMANMRLMNEAALRVYEMGHLPVLGEWYALPLMETAGSRQIGDEIFERMFHPSAVRLLSHCDAVLRIGGPSKGADEMVSTAEAKGKRVYRDISEIPALALR
ncbi:GDP-mannose pyrophosphatase NudK [Paenibacillus guangzhouensis]|uniref:GDP-mannose pyrophosphatase NudK n=1 Tax=Paenibacillus guangzhouensis TaxID=1473112 RepID=UPI00126714F1|nr:GDP-mannose pyrophosphatase NudK [Paenibacillus guangzhouensis]